MMPSRGLQAIRGSAPRLYQQQCRNLSSRTLPRASSLPSANSSIRTSQWRSRAPGAMLSLSAIRYASTTPTTPTPGPASTAQAPITEPASTATASPTLHNLDTITLDDVQLAASSDSLANLPEQIGYLKAVGLDYGYGPTAMIEWTLEHIHIDFGLPWWGAIAATAILMRAITFPLYLKSADQAARNQAMMPVIKPISERMQAAQKAGDQTAVMQAWQDMSATRKRAGLTYTAQFAPMVLQSVLGFCSFKLMRGMANLPVPGLKEGGFGWITDLTVSDGYLILPAVMAGAMHVMFRYGGETGSNDLMNPGMKAFMLWGMPGIIFLVTGWQAGAVCIWFVASGAWAMGQAMLMQKPAVRNFFGITPLYNKNKAGASGGLADFVKAQMEGNKSPGGKTITTTATSKPADATPKMTYQAPNVRTTTARGTSRPASAAASASAAAQAAPQQKAGMFDGLKKLGANVKDMARERNEKAAREAVARAAADYEKRAQRKRELGKGGR